LETFTELKELVDNPHYQAQKQKTLSGLTDDMIDLPIVELIRGYNDLPYCFTLQSCYGHFVYKGQKNIRNLHPLSAKEIIGEVEYRIAYLALCIEKSAAGKGLFETLKEIAVIDPWNVQFGCAEWFWKRQVNSFALQVEPDRFKYKDTAILDYREALNIEKTRNEFFVRLYGLLENIRQG
jgi:hypothetical protein